MDIHTYYKNTIIEQKIIWSQLTTWSFKLSQKM